MTESHSFEYPGVRPTKRSLLGRALSALIRLVLSPIAFALYAGIIVSNLAFNGHTLSAIASGIMAAQFCVLVGVLISARGSSPLAQLLASFYVWALWRFAGFRRIDLTSMQEMLPEGGYVADPIDLHTTRSGHLIVTTAMRPPTPEEAQAISDAQEEARWRGRHL